MSGNKERLDILVVSRGLVESRQKAKACIMSGEVFVDEVRCDKPGTLFNHDAQIEVRSKRIKYVSRGGYKLEKALDVFKVDPEGVTALDAGASTGGFTDCLLQRGASRVYAADVGYGQLAWSLRCDSRVVCMERTNVRYLTRDDLGESVDLAVMDLSFISVQLILPAVASVLKDGGRVICLVKPQFEAGRDKVGKKGVVREPAVHAEVLRDFCSGAEKKGFSVKGLSFSPIKGPEGNIEYLGYLAMDGERSEIPDIDELVRASHDELDGI